MVQALVSLKVDRPETLLLAITKDGTIKIGLPPRHRLDSYHARAATLGKLENVSHVICSPEGELFCVRVGNLYRGTLPSKKDVDWFSTARRVGKWEWSKFKSLFFHPNGELYGTTTDGAFFKGPQPNNNNVPWMYGQATKIGDKGWEQCSALFFDQSGFLYAVTKQDQLVKGEAPTQEYEEWLKSTEAVGVRGCLQLSHFMSFCPEGKLWCVDKGNGNMYKGIVSATDGYLKSSQNLGLDYHAFRFLSFTKDKTIRDVISFQFLLERGQRVSECPEVIEERIYDNRRSTSIVTHSFLFDKQLKVYSSFSHEHGFAFEAGAEIAFKAGIPFMEKTNATVKLNRSTIHKWSFTDTNETEVTFPSSSQVELQAGKAIRLVVSVVKAELIVPYRAEVRTLHGFETEIEGTWSGTTMYNLMVTQEDYGDDVL